MPFLKIISHYKDGCKYALEADLINFFGEVNKQDLLENQIFPQLKDNSLNELIISALNQGIGGLEKFNDEQKSITDIFSRLMLWTKDFIVLKENNGGDFFEVMFADF